MGMGSVLSLQSRSHSTVPLYNVKAFAFMRSLHFLPNGQSPYPLALSILETQRKNFMFSHCANFFHKCRSIFRPHSLRPLKFTTEIPEYLLIQPDKKWIYGIFKSPVKFRKDPKIGLARTFEVIFVLYVQKRDSMLKFSLSFEIFENSKTYTKRILVAYVISLR